MPVTRPPSNPRFAPSSSSEIGVPGIYALHASRPECEKGGKFSFPKDRPIMLKTGILNPAINPLRSRVRHTNTLAISDRGFPCWPEIETVDISLVDGIPSELQDANTILVSA